MDTVALAKKIRIQCLHMTSRGGGSHIGSAFSIADIIAVLYGGNILNVRAREPKWPSRDRFVLSKGHAGVAVYVALAELGFLDQKILDTYYLDGSILCGHLSHKGVAGVEISTGSLGHGLSIATGMAYGAKLDDEKYRSFCLLSDGECDEGSTWEPILFAAHHKLDNLVAIVDYNKIQSLKPVAETVGLEPFADKWKSFGWEVIEVEGHNHEQLQKTLASVPKVKGKPTCVIAHTTKGKGVSFMENTVLWHYRVAKGEEFDAALKELEAKP